MSVEVGNVVEGKVAGITNFGAFVQLPDGNTGLVHISEVAEEYIKDIKTHLNENQVVKVKILSVGTNGKISLSIKKALDRFAVIPETEQAIVGMVQPIGERPQVATLRYPRNDRFDRHDRHDRGSRNTSSTEPTNFEDRLARFMKDSDERMHDLKKNFESKRGSGRK